MCSLQREMVSIFKTTKNKNKLNYEGYTYFFDKEVKERYYWCCEFRKKKCNGRAVTIVENGNHNVQSTKPHNHQEDPTRKSVLDTLNKIEATASTSSTRPNELLRGIKRNLEEDVLVELPSNSALAKKVKRCRHELYGKENISGTNFDLPESAKDYKGEPFVIADNQNPDNRIIIFGTRVGLELLYRARLVLMDGTFTSCPLGFSQLYTIHTSIRCKGNLFQCLIY